jgi:hypothetical protein
MSDEGGEKRRVTAQTGATEAPHHSGWREIQRGHVYVLTWIALTGCEELSLSYLA